MRNSYRVLWTGVAKRDLREIVEFIACDSPDNAMKILHHILNSRAFITMPRSGHVSECRVP